MEPRIIYSDKKLREVFNMLFSPTALIRRKKIVKRLLSAGAVSADTAKTFHEVGLFKGLGLITSRLESRGILVKVNDERYYVNKR